MELGPLAGLDVGAEQRAAIELVVAERYVLRLWPSVRAGHLREVLAALLLMGIDFWNRHEELTYREVA